MRQAGTSVETRERPAGDRFRGWVSDRRLHQVLWGFVGLGAALRLWRFLLRFPLSTDEARLASSWIDRGFLELLQPLDYWQVAPTLFMWCNLAVIKVLGFSELPLRLLSLALGLVSLLLMRRLCLRLLPAVPALLAVALLAVSYYPVRLAAEAKPYSADLFFAVLLTVLAVEAAKEPRQLRWLVALAAVAPLAVGASYPSVFIIGGVGLGMLPAIWKAGRWPPRLLWGAFVATSLASFAAVFFWIIPDQYQAFERSGTYLEFWTRSMPSLDDPVGLIGWLVFAHTGRTFGYPVGADYGGSLLTFACFAFGAALLYRARARWALAILLLPFALMLGAALLGYYPYGGSGRISQNLAPAICLLAGLGLAWLLSLRRDGAARRRGLVWALALLALFGIVFGVRDLFRPYLEKSGVGAREFARTLWTEKARDAELLCAVVDSPEGARHRGQLPFLPRYWSNQRIYSERHRRGEPPRWERVSASHPLRVAVPVVVLDAKAESSLPPSMRAAISGAAARASAFLEGLESRYRQVGFERLLAERYRDAQVWVELYELVPRRSPDGEPDPAGSAGTALTTSPSVR